MSNYTVLHCHTELSNGTTNIDSVTKYEDYIKRASELGMKSIAITEHGNILSWLKKKDCCEKYGLKYIHGIEAYLTETIDTKVRDNYHCCLYARNWEGVKELNKLISNSYNRNDNHFYYTPRILIDDLFKTSNNIIVASACLGGVFNKGNDEVKKRMLDFFIKNKDRCFLEIQHHNVKDQIEYNKYLFKLSQEYGLKLVTNTDTHCLDKKHVKGRDILQRAKNIRFDNEDGWDLTFKSYDELIESYKQQNSLPMFVILEAMENTNRIADMIEEFTMDKSYKYPKLYDNSEDVLKQKINEGVIRTGIDKLPNYETEYLPRIYSELETYKHNGAVDFLLLDENIKTWGREHDIYPGYSRGSCSGSLICYLLGITDVDSVLHKLNFERFMNTERVSLADIDTDWQPNQREAIKDYVYSMEGLYCADIITFNTVALKGSIRDCARALKIDLSIVNDICENINDDNIESYREQYKELFEYVDIVNGTVVSIGTHPCGQVVSPIPLDENMGLLTLATCKNPVTMLNMKEIDSLNYVKLDILGLDNIQIINETCKLAGIERLTPQNVDDNDEAVWQSIKEDTLGIFQWDGSGSYYIKDLFSDETIKRIKEVYPDFRYIDLMACGNGAIRPAGASYRDELAQGIFRDNGHKALNDLLAPTLGYLVYQEQIIAFLNQFCGYTMGEADIVRRGFAKKTGTEQFIPQIKSGFIKTMKEKYEVEEEESEHIVESFIQVIEDASSYLFSLNHSLPYSYIGYICGYLRYYYPLEFMTVVLNVCKDDAEKTNKAIDYVKKHNMVIKPPKFRYSRAEYFMDKETNSIYKGMASIKYMNAQVSEELYKLKDNQYNNFMDLLIDVYDKTSINSRQLSILIVIDFFEEFGKSQKLLDIVELYENIMSKKLKSKKGEVSFNKADLPYPQEIIEKYATEKSKEDKYKQYKVERALELCNELMNDIPNIEMPSIYKIRMNFDTMGECNYYFEDYNPTTCIVVDVITKFKTKKAWLFSIASGHIAEVNIGEGYYNLQPFKALDVIDVFEITQKPKKERREVEVEDKNGNKVTKMKYVPTGEMRLYLSEYHLLDKEEIDKLNEEEKEYREGLLYED